MRVSAILAFLGGVALLAALVGFSLRLRRRVPCPHCSETRRITRVQPSPPLVRPLGDPTRLPRERDRYQDYRCRSCQTTFRTVKHAKSRKARSIRYY